MHSNIIINHLHSALIDDYNSDLAESKAKLERLNEKLAELQVQKNENEVALVEAQRRIDLQKNSTTAEVFRLKGIYFP